ncbi:MAG: sodium ion-translocating decarboxylase subunit beta [Clostridiaceae bacterium]|nr:sodium ion-translocating decarboxylase subunit beta [Clostridiaceae bacterium]
MLDLIQKLFSGVMFFGTKDGLLCLGMYAIGAVLIYLAIAKDYEPNLLLPIGFGAILANLPPAFYNAVGEGFPGVIGTPEEPGFLQVLFDAGIASELFPILIFIAVGAMIDFGPLLKNPYMIFFGAAAQFGIFATFLIALAVTPLAGITDPDLRVKLSAAIGIIGAADGPTTIYVANLFKLGKYIAPITVAAYSYMAMVPIIQPPVIRLLTSRKERLIRMEYQENSVSKTAKIIFPIAITIIAGILVPMSAALVGSLMFGNLIRECGVLDKLSKAAQNELSSLVTILLGITIGSTMRAADFLALETLLILLLGLGAFVFDTAGGVLFAKLFNVFLKKKINPMIGAAGISAFPMSARVIQKMAKDEDPTNFVLMQSISANVAGQLGSIVAGGIIIALVAMFFTV